jgi:hypothetical protein
MLLRGGSCSINVITTLLCMWEGYLLLIFVVLLYSNYSTECMGGFLGHTDAIEKLGCTPT